MSEEKFNDAKKIFKLGMDKSQQFCLTEYLGIILKESQLNQFLSDYKIANIFLNYLCLEICFNKILKKSFYYAVYYLTKRSSFKDIIKNNYHQFALDIYNNVEKITDNYSEIQIDNYLTYGKMCYYGILGLIDSNKEKSLNIFKKGYKLAKEKDYNNYKRINYLYIYKIRKYLFKNNKITLRKLNKTKEKLFRFYEETEETDLSSIELYNYYKLYKFGVIGFIHEKIIRLLKYGKKERIIYDFSELVYREKCKCVYEMEFSTSYPNHYNTLLKNEFLENKNNITLNFRTTEGQTQYKLLVPSDIQFIKVVHKLLNTYPELETKKIGTYICNANKIGLFDTVQENNLENGSIILIIHKNSNYEDKKVINDQKKVDNNANNNLNFVGENTNVENNNINENDNINLNEQQQPIFNNFEIGIVDENNGGNIEINHEEEKIIIIL